MKKYNAIIGIWVAAAVDNPEIATVPGKLGPHNESNFIVPILDLGISMPKEALSKFKQFSKPRFISRITSNYYEGDRLKKVTANIQEDWMMGGLWGVRDGHLIWIREHIDGMLNSLRGGEGRKD